MKPEALTKFGLIDFEFVGDPVILEVHLFSASTFEGEPVETEGKSDCLFTVSFHDTNSKAMRSNDTGNLWKISSKS